MAFSPDGSLITQLDTINGQFILDVGGTLQVHSNTHYSNILFDSFQFTNNGNIRNSQLNVYNNMIISSNGINHDSFGTSLYSISTSNPDINNYDFCLWNSNNSNVYISSPSNVGIRTNTPVCPLHVVGDVLIDGQIMTTLGGGIELARGATKATYCGTMSYKKFSSSLEIVGASTSDTTDRKVRIYDKLGVQKDPSYSLDVQGDVNYSGNLLKNGSLVDFTGGTYTLPEPLSVNQINASTANITSLNSTTINATNLVNAGQVNIGGSSYYNIQSVVSLSKNILSFNSYNSGSGLYRLSTHQFVEDGSCYRSDNSSQWSTVSDKSLKKDIKDLHGSLDIINRLKPCSFLWRKPEAHCGQTDKQYGFIAQNVQDVLPHLVKTTKVNPLESHLVEKDECLSLNQEFMPWIIQAIQELHKNNEELKDELIILRALINTFL